MRKVTLKKLKQGEDDFHERVREWQEAGPEAILRACWELTELCYGLKGEYLKGSPMDKTRFEKRQVPWLKGDLDG